MPTKRKKEKIVQLQEKKPKVENAVILEEEVSHEFENLSEEKIGTDFYREHFDRELDDSCIAVLDTALTKSKETSVLELPSLGNGVFSKISIADVDVKCPERLSGNLESAGVRKRLVDNLRNGDLSHWQRDFFGVLNSYTDCLLPRRPTEKVEDLTEVLCLHALNHALKCRQRVMHNNSKLKEAEEQGELTVDMELRDQGLVRPKTLILVPFKDSALQILEMMIKLLFGKEEKQYVMNKKRFFSEFRPEGPPPLSHAEKPDDFRSTFNGNTDDCFRVGLGMAKNTLKLYVDFYSADILIASPLGLRMIVGGEGEEKNEHDFLSSIEVLIVDQADILFMQSWQQVLHVMESVNKKPKEQHGTDYSRVRLWALNEWSKFYRQTVLISKIALPEFRAIFGSYCKNYAGLLELKPEVSTQGCLPNITVSLPQAYQRFQCANPSEESDARFEFFTKRVLPQYIEAGMRHTLVYVPSYFDFVRIRNYFKKQTVSFVQCCEYSKLTKISRARDLFFHAKKHFLLMSERFHFYRRYKVRGIHNLIFYQVPTYGIFYEEFCNMIGGEEEEEVIPTCSVLLSKFDGMRLSRIIGAEKAKSVILAESAVHTIK